MHPDLLSQLRDIHGLDALPWWYISPLWWLLGVLIVLVPLLLRRVRLKRAWWLEARRALLDLKKRLRDKKESDKALLSDFAVLLRRIAVARHGRRACAGLHGEAWLEWLRDNDPKGFTWDEQGAFLLHSVYAPPDLEIDRKALKKLIQAALEWAVPPADEKHFFNFLTLRRAKEDEHGV